MEKNSKTFTKDDFYTVTLACPKCSHKINYEYYNIENIGKFHCTNCDYKSVKKANTTKSVAENTTALSTNTDLIIKAVSTIPDRNVEYFNSGELIASSVQLSLWCGDQQIPNDKVIWFSNNALDISVDANGNLDYYLLGAKATITATYGEKSVSIKAAGHSGGCIREEKVPQYIWIKVFENSIDTNYTGSKVDKNIWIRPNNENTIQLVGVISPNDCPDKTLTFLSSDPSIVSVDADGNIVGLKSGGRAAIIVTAVNGVDEHIYINVY